MMFYIYLSNRVNKIGFRMYKELYMPVNISNLHNGCTKYSARLYECSYCRATMSASFTEKIF